MIANRQTARGLLEGAGRDLQFALRSLRREPALVAGIVATFALAIGANAAMVSLVARLMLSAPPGVNDPSSLGRLHVEATSIDGERYAMTTMSYPAFQAARAQENAFAAVAASRSERLTTGRGAEMAEVSVIAATGNYFRVLGTRPALGRFFDDDDDALPTGNAVTVLSHAYWERRYGGRPTALGEHITIDDQDYIIVGVAPRGFSGDALAPVDVFVPLTVAQRKDESPWATSQGIHFVSVIVRIRDRKALPAAMGMLTSSLRSHSGDDQVLSAGVEPLLADGGASPRQTRTARWLAGVSLVVLLVAIANVATLLLLRAARRRREIAVRLALGAGRARLARQLLVEGWLLSSLGAAAALLVAKWAAALVRVTLLPDLAPSEQFIEPSALVVAIAAAAVAGLVAGLAPYAQASRRDVAAELQGGRSASGRFGIQRTLITVQVALCTVLLFGAGLFVRSLQRLEAQDLGFSTARLLLVEFDFRETLIGSERDRLYTVLADRLTTVPGVTGATIVQGMPFGNFNVPPISVPGRSEPPSIGGQLPYMYAATPAYLDLMGVSVREGRLFKARDGRGTPLVVLVNETFARTVWPGQSAIGKCIRAGFDPSAGEPSPLAPATLPCREVVGVVRDSRVRSLQPTGNEARLMQYYVPFGQQPEPFMHAASQVDAMLVGSAGDPQRIISAVQRFIQGASPTPVYARVQPYEDLLDPQLRPWRLGATLFSALGGLALVIAAVGLFAVVSYLVTQRSREIGIRLALGGTAPSIGRLIVAGALRLVALGAVLGAIAAIVLTPLVQSMLFDTSMRDVSVILTISGVLGVVALAAAALPALRAARVNPSVTLQAE
ncbi:MAG TPA: ADOP family duplicated permease [Gemmatimonadaceae bacterium]|jgi:predicted permease